MKIRRGGLPALRSWLIKTKKMKFNRHGQSRVLSTDELDLLISKLADQHHKIVAEICVVLAAALARQRSSPGAWFRNLRYVPARNHQGQAGESVGAGYAAAIGSPVLLESCLGGAARS